MMNAYAKINLALDVLSRRDDGYHEVEMIMQGISLADKVNLSLAKTIQVETNLPYLAGDKTNLAYKAAALMQDRYNVQQGVHIKLEKNIPVAAGLAGGSADAATVLKGVNELWGLHRPIAELVSLGAELGSDVPFCLELGTMRASGRGEKLTPLPDVPFCWFVLAKPRVSVSTAWVYQNYHAENVEQHPDIPQMIDHITNKNLAGVAGLVANVLESVTIPVHPQIQKLKKIMLNYGAIASLMSGSGPTVFGMTSDLKSAQYIANMLQQQTQAMVILAHTVGKMGDTNGTAFAGKT